MPVNSMVGRTRSASGGAGIMEVMSNSSSRRFPVTTVDLPVTHYLVSADRADGTCQYVITKQPPR